MVVKNKDAEIAKAHNEIIKTYNNLHTLSGPPESKFSFFSEFEDLTLMDLEVITTLGIGGFGRVELVQVKMK